MIAEATHTGMFHVAEHQMIEGVLRLPDRTVRSIMVPRGDVVWLDAADDRKTVWNAVRTSGHSRYPVCRGQLDELLGIVMTGELAEWLGDRRPASWPRACARRWWCTSPRASCGCSNCSANRRCTSP